MTSTNDGKDVKSNQSSGQKGKSYYIELYKSLDALLSGDCDLRSRTLHLCEAWRRVHSLCLHALPATNEHLVAWVQRHTAKTILQTEWQSPKSKNEQTSLEEAIDSFIADCETGSARKDGVSPSWETQLQQRGEWFKRILANPWGHPVLRALLDPQGKRPGDGEILEWLKEERGVMFVTRLRQLAASKCNDLAMALVTAVMDRVRAATDVVPDNDQADKSKDNCSGDRVKFANILNTEAGFTLDVWDVLTDIEFVLLHKGDRRSKCIELAKQTPLRDGYQLVERLQSRLEASPREKKLWKNAKDVATLVAQVIIARCMVIPVCAHVSRTALYCCARSLVRLLPPARLPAAAAALAAPAATARHLHTLAQAVDAQCSKDMKPFVCELYVRAITAGMNELERLKLKTEKEGETRATELTLSTWFTQLGSLLSASSRVECECSLTAFSVHPSPDMYEKIKAAPVVLPVALDTQDIKEETKSEFGSWTTDSRTQSNLVKTSETLNMKHTQNQANVLSTAILTEGEALGLSPELCQDLAVLLSGPRLKTLSWDMDREVLLENCRKYMEGGGTRALTTELKYLNLDPSSYMHLPEDDDEENDLYYGIEKGYEHLVELQEPEDVWQNAFDAEKTESACSSSVETEIGSLRRKKKTKKINYCEEDSDPLSYIAEVKRTEKKKERPHSKERSNKDGNKERKKKKSKEHSEDKEGSREGRKETDGKDKKKEKKPRKKKTKDQESDTPTDSKPGSLSSLIGMKVAKINIPEGKYKKTDTKVSLCVTDSDYDSQGKSSLASLNSEGNDPDVLFDGLFNMEDYKSPETDPLADRNSLMNREMTVANGKVAISTPSAKTPEIAKPKPQSQSITTDPAFVNTPKNVNIVREEVKKSISRLIEFRRQKAIFEESQRNSASPGSASSSPHVKKDSSVPTYKIPNAIIRPECLDAPLITSPKALSVPEIPKVYINKNQFEQFEPKYEEMPLNSKCSNNPVIQYANKSGPTTSMNYSDMYLQSVLRCDKVNPSTQYNQNPIQYPHTSYNDIAQKNLHDFLKELQESINAGTGSKRPSTSSETKQRKEIKPVSRVTPVLPKNLKAEPGVTSQCAKSSLPSTKKIEGSQLNTFSRLSYMHKTKQTDLKTNRQAVESLANYHEQLVNKAIEDQKQSRLSYLQTKGDVVISRVGQTPHNLTAKEEAKVIVRKVDKTTSAMKEHPLLSNMLQSNKTKSIPENQTARTVPHQIERPRVKIPAPVVKESALSERDQNDLLLLLRQQNKLNFPSYKYSDLNKAPSNNQCSNISVTNNTPSNCNQLAGVNRTVIKSNPTELKQNNTQNYESYISKTSTFKAVHPNPIDSKSGKISAEKKLSISLINVSNAAAPYNNPIQSKSQESWSVMDNNENASRNEDSKHQDWVSVMDAILKHKTPSRGPNALDMVLKKDSLSHSNLRNQRIVRSNQVVDRDVKTNENSKPPQVQTVARHTMPEIVLHKRMNQVHTPVIEENIKKEYPPPATTSVIKNPVHSEQPTKQVEVQKKQFASDFVKEKDPFISGIPNSDYDLLEELMDDELRKEIGELSSDEETYRTPVPKGNKTGSSSKNINVIKTILPQQEKSQAVDLRCSLKSLQVIRSSIIQENKQSTKCSNVVKSVTQQVAVPNDTNKSSPAEYKVTKVPESTKQCPTKVIQQPQVNVMPSINQHIESQSYNICQNINNNHINVVNPRNVIITAVPRPVVPNVVLLGPELVYDPFATMQSQLQTVAAVQQHTTVTGLCNMQAPYVTLNAAPNITVFQTTQFAAPIVEDVIIGNAMTMPMPTVASESIMTNACSQMHDNSGNRNGFIKPNNVIVDCSKDLLASKIIDSNNVQAETKIQNVISQPLQAETVPRIDSEISLDINSNKNSDRKVLSEVQDVNNTEIIETKVSQKLPENDIKHIHKAEEKSQVDNNRVAKSRNEVTIKEQKDSLVHISQNNVKDQERLKKKRIAILNREITHRSSGAPIPLDYIPLLKKIQKYPVNNKQVPKETLDNNIVSDNVSANSVPNKILNHEQDAEHSKENQDETTPCRRILLRSSNDMKAMTVFSSSQDQRNPVGRKTKVRLKQSKAERIETKANDQSNHETTTGADKDSPVRVSKRILKKQTKKKLNNATNKSIELKSIQENTSNKKQKVSQNNTILVKTLDKNEDVNKVDDSINAKNTSESEIITTHAENKIDQPINSNVTGLSEIDIEKALTVSKIPKTIESKSKNDDKNDNEIIVRPGKSIRGKKTSAKSKQVKKVVIPIKTSRKNIIVPEIVTPARNSKSLGRTSIGAVNKNTLQMPNTAKTVIMQAAANDIVPHKKTVTVDAIIPVIVNKTNVPKKSAMVQSICGNTIITGTKSYTAVLNETNNKSLKKETNTCLNRSSPKSDVNKINKINEVKIVNKPVVNNSINEVKVVNKPVVNNSINEVKVVNKPVVNNSKELGISSVTKDKHVNTNSDSLVSKKDVINAKNTDAINVDGRIIASDNTLNVINDKGQSNAIKQNVLPSDSNKNCRDIGNHQNIEKPSPNNENIEKSNDLQKDQAIFDAWKDKITIEELPPSPTSGADKKCVRIKLPNGKTFKATVVGKMHVSYESLFADPILRSVLLNNINDTRRYTVNIKQVSTSAKNDPSKIVATRIEEVNVSTTLPTEPIETVNLLSDDEEECVSQKNHKTKTLKTEFGEFKLSLNDEDFYKHERKLQQRCFVKLSVLTETSVKKAQCDIQTDSHTTITNEINVVKTESVYLPTDLAPVVAPIASETIDKKLSSTKQIKNITEILTTTTVFEDPPLIPIPETLSLPDIIEIDDSSNDSVDLNVNKLQQCHDNTLIEGIRKGLMDKPGDIVEKPADDIDELKNLLLKDLGVDVISDVDKLKHDDLNMNSVNVTNTDSLGKSTNNKSCFKTKECYVKLLNCDDLVNKYEQIKIMNQKCTVDLFRCDNNITTNTDITSYDRDESDELIEFDAVDNNSVSSECRLTRSGSFSLLDDLSLYLDGAVDDSQNKYDRSSPVMEAFETISSLRKATRAKEECLSVMEVFEIIASIRRQKQTEQEILNSVQCSCDWHTTKRSLHVSSKLLTLETKPKLVNIPLFYESTFTSSVEEQSYTIPTLKTLTVKVFQDHNILNQYNTYFTMNVVSMQSPSHKLKRKLRNGENTKVASKISKIIYDVTHDRKSIDLRNENVIPRATPIENNTELRGNDSTSVNINVSDKHEIFDENVPTVSKNTTHSTIDESVAQRPSEDLTTTQKDIIDVESSGQDSYGSDVLNIDGTVSNESNSCIQLDQSAAVNENTSKLNESNRTLENKSNILCDQAKDFSSIQDVDRITNDEFNNVSHIKRIVNQDNKGCMINDVKDEQRYENDRSDMKTYSVLSTKEDDAFSLEKPEYSNNMDIKVNNDDESKRAIIAEEESFNVTLSDDNNKHNDVKYTLEPTTTLKDVDIIKSDEDMKSNISNNQGNAPSVAESYVNNNHLLADNTNVLLEQINNSSTLCEVPNLINNDCKREIVGNITDAANVNQRILECNSQNNTGNEKSDLAQSVSNYDSGLNCNDQSTSSPKSSVVVERVVEDDCSISTKILNKNHYNSDNNLIDGKKDCHKNYNYSDQNELNITLEQSQTKGSTEINVEPCEAKVDDKLIENSVVKMKENSLNSPSHSTFDTSEDNVKFEKPLIHSNHPNIDFLTVIEVESDYDCSLDCVTRDEPENNEVLKTGADSMVNNPEMATERPPSTVNSVISTTQLLDTESTSEDKIKQNDTEKDQKAQCFSYENLVCSEPKQLETSEILSGEANIDETHISETEVNIEHQNKPISEILNETIDTVEKVVEIQSELNESKHANCPSYQMVDNIIEVSKPVKITSTDRDIGRLEENTSSNEESNLCCEIDAKDSNTQMLLDHGYALKKSNRYSFLRDVEEESQSSNADSQESESPRANNISCLQIDVNEPRNDDEIILNGIQYDDPEMGTYYVFPITKFSTICPEKDFYDDDPEEIIQVTQEINEDGTVSNVTLETKEVPSEETYYKLILPKLTYSRLNRLQEYSISTKKPMKRKIDMSDIRISEKKYRNGKNIDYPKITVAAKIDSAYSKEFKQIFNYCSSLKFSYSQPFHSDYIDVDEIIKNWPIAQAHCQDLEGSIDDEFLFCDLDDIDRCKVFNPADQSLADEINAEYNQTDYQFSNITETNFKMGFGERSDRVIQNLKDVDDNSKFSAATLSDVKQPQPFLLSENYSNCNTDQGDISVDTREDQIKKIKRYMNYIQMREKVRSFFKKTTIELKRDWMKQEKERSVKCDFTNFPFDLYNSTDYIKPPSSDILVQVVQVGQLPVSAAAQNPVTCDPRVTQVSDASPSQCSVDNSPSDDSQPTIKTEYTELTTAEMPVPLMQEYAQHNQTLDSQATNIPMTDENIPIETEIKSEVKIELMEEPEERDEYRDTYENCEPQSIENNHVNNVDYSFDTHSSSATPTLEPEPDYQTMYNSSDKQDISETYPTQQEPKQNGAPEKTDQIAHAMNAAGITTTSETMTNTTRAHALVNILSQKLRQGSVGAAQAATNNYPKATSINAMALQQALAQILPPPLNQTNATENNQQVTNTPVTPQVLHIVQGKNASGSQITLVDNSQQSVINAPNATPVLHIVQNKSGTAGATSNGAATPQTNSFGGISLVDAGLQQGGNQLLHIVNTGSQKNNNAAGQLLKRVNLLTNLTNVQGSNEQKMVQFVCKSADGKAIQLNAPHQRSMVLRLQPIEAPNVQATSQKQAENQDLSPTSNSTNSLPGKDNSASQQEIKSRSVYEENYAKFIQNASNKSTVPEKSTSLPKFNQAFGKPVFQEGNQNQNDINSNNSHLSVSTKSEPGECQPNDNAINLDHIGQISSPPLLLRKSPAQTSQPQANLVQQLKQTITPMNIQTMHGGVIYTRQIPVNIGGGQTINLITVPSTELVDDSGQKQQTVGSQNEMEPSIIKIVPQNQTASNSEISSEDGNASMNVTNDTNQNPQPQPVLTQMRIKLPMLSKAPQMVSGARVVRPSFFQIQRNVIGGTNQPVYQQLVLTAAPPLGQQTIRLPQTQTRQIKVPTDNQSSAESQMSSSTLEQLREFDMVLEQVKERSSVPPNSSSSTTFPKLHTPSSDTTDGSSASSSSTETTQQVLYSIGNNHQPLNVAYVNRKATVTTPTTSTFVRSPDSSGIVDSPTSSTHVQTPHTITTDSSQSDPPTQPKPKVSSKSKSRPKASSNPPSNLKLNTVPPKTSAQKPLEDEQTTQRILYILAEYKEQVENSPDKDKPAPRRRSNPPSNPSGSSKRKKSSSGSRRHGRDLSPIHGEDTCRTMGSEDSSCGTSQGDCNESCLESHSPQDSPRKVVRKLTFEQETPAPTPRPQPQRNVIVADGQTITVARGTAGKPATAVLMPANYILPVSMVKGGQQIAIVTNRGPKLLTVGGGEGGATNALLLQRLIGPAGLKPVLARPGVRHVRLPTAALHNLQAFNLATATTIQPPDSTASPAPAPTPPELVDTRATSSPWTDQDMKPERGSSPEGSEPWHLPSSGDPHDYSYEETVRADNLDRTVLDPIPDRYSPDMEAQRIFDKMFDVESKKSYMGDSPRCAYDIDASDCDDKPYHQVVQKKDGSSHRQHRLTHVSAAALRHKYAILEHELRLQKSLSEECEDLGVDSPSASELFPEAELLFATSPAHDHTQDHGHHSHTPQPTLMSQSCIPQPDMDDQIATDQLLPRNEMHGDHQDLNLGLEDVGIVTVSEDGMQATIALDQEEFARSHPNTTFHSEPEEGEVQQPFTIAGLKGRHITSTIFHSNRAPATVLMTAPQTTVISQAIADHNPPNTVKYSDIDNMINSLPSANGNNINLSSVLVKDEGLTRFDSILNDSRELHLSNTASAIVHSAGNATQVIRRVCYDDDKRDNRFLMDEPEGLIAGDDAKMIAEDSSRDATLESMVGDVDDDRSSPERHAELFWESNSASERSESRRPLDFSSDSDKCCKSPSYDETNSTDSSGVGAHMRLDSVIKDARGIERSGSADGSSADDTHPPLRTYPPKRMYHPLDGEMERSLSGKTRAGERSPDSLEVRRRASGRGVVKRGCHCCNGSPAPPRPKKSRQRKPTMDFATN